MLHISQPQSLPLTALHGHLQDDVLLIMGLWLCEEEMIQLGVGQQACTKKVGNLNDLLGQEYTAILQYTRYYMTTAPLTQATVDAGVLLFTPSTV